MRRLLSFVPLYVLLKAIGIAVLVLASCVYSLALAHSTGSATSLWIANGILVGGLLRLRTRHWWMYLLFGLAGNAGARLLLHDPLLVSLGLAMANTVEVLIVSGVIRRRFPEITSDTPYLGLGYVALTSTLVACAVSALFAGFVAHTLQGAPLFTYLNGWYRAHVLGMVIVATTTLVALTDKWSLLGTPGKRCVIWL